MAKLEHPSRMRERGCGIDSLWCACDGRCLPSLHEPMTRLVNLQAVQIIQEKIHAFDGCITRLITDDKGTRFLIAFGLPGHSTEGEDELRAVRSSLEAAKELRRLPGVKRGSTIDLAVGITSGRAFCGQAGAELRVEYTLAGAAVNLAARLMQAADKMGKGILVDEQVASPYTHPKPHPTPPVHPTRTPHPYTPPVHPTHPYTPPTRTPHPPPPTPTHPTPSLPYPRHTRRALQAHNGSASKSSSPSR